VNLWTHVDWSRLTAYLANELSPDDHAALEAWIAAHPQRADAIARVRAAWALAGSPKPYAWDLASMRTAVDQARMAEGQTAIATPSSRIAGVSRRMARRTPSSRGSLRVRRLVALGAAVALGVAVVIAEKYLTTSSTSAPRIYHTAAEQQATVTLADGSRVTLAPQTTLEVDGAFGGTTRTVTLRGEALFDIAHRGGAPFTVRAGRVVTRVLGTTFDVKYYDGDPNVRVTVATGKVSTGATRAPITLTAGTIAYVTDSTVNASTVRDVSAYTEWTTGTLRFDEVTIPALLQSVGRWYGVQFQLSDSSLATGHVTLTIAHKTQAEALVMLETLLDVTMTFDRGANGVPVVMLHPRRGVHSPTRRESPAISTPKPEVGR